MTIITPVEVENELARLASLLEQRTDELATLLRQAAEADSSYRLGFARQLLKSEGSTVGEREAEALVICAGLLRERRITEAIAEAAKESVRSLRIQISALQSLNANIREQAGLA